MGEEAFDFGDFFAGDAALGEGDLDFGDFFPGVGVLGEAFFFFFGDGVMFAELSAYSCSNSLSKPMTDARLRRDCLGLRRHKLLRGVAPLRNGESGGSFLSNNSGLR